MGFLYMSLFIIYLIFSVLVAYVGRNVTIGFGGVFVMCLLLTPLLTAILILIFRVPKPADRISYTYKVSDLADLEGGKQKQDEK